MTDLPAPTCDSCGGERPSDGFTLDPVSLEVVCLTCAYPDAKDRAGAERAAMRASIERFRDEFGRLPASSWELLEYLNGGELPELGKGSVYIGPGKPRR
jgi:hypothetical protein